MARIPDSGYVLIVDLNKCIGCQACAVACKTWWVKDTPGTHHIWWLIVSTMPGMSYPRNWLEKSLRGEPPSPSDYEPYVVFPYEKLFNNTTGEVPPRIIPEPIPSYGPNWDWDEGVGEKPEDAWYFYLPLQCMHCDNPKCMEVCPAGAIYKTEEGVVMVDQYSCVGCMRCMNACPYKRMFIDRERFVASKCILCLPLVRRGEPPLCVRACNMRARYFGRIDDPESPVYIIAKKYGVALPLLPQFNTNPRVLYIPPVLEPPRADGKPRYDPKYLELLFGKEVWRVKEVLERERAKGEASELMRVLRSWPTWKL